jgi:hypothetical protein
VLLDSVFRAIHWAWLLSSSSHRNLVKITYRLQYRAIGEERKNNDANGIGLYGQDVSNPITVDYPASIDLQRTKEHLEADIANGKDADGSRAKTLHIIQQFASTGGLGTVVHASGCI